jgi:hypothetical protein
MIKNHYIPQKYLKGFTNESGKVFCYGENSEPFEIKPKNIAYEKGLYSDETETYLANEIEEPFNQIIYKMLSREKFVGKDREKISKYLVVLLKRTIKNRFQYEKSAGSIAEDATEKLVQKVEDEEIFANMQKELVIQQLLLGMSNFKNNPSREVWEDIMKPEATPSITTAINLMQWTIFVAKKQSFFITCDHPIFFHAEIGIGGAPYSTMSVPLNQKYCLFLYWTDTFPPDYVYANEKIVKQINIRTIYNRYQQVYSPRNEEWIINYLHRHQLPEHIIPKGSIPKANYFSMKKIHNDYEERYK